jgi:hypothetical protein
VATSYEDDADYLTNGRGDRLAQKDVLKDYSVVEGPYVLDHDFPLLRTVGIDPSIHSSIHPIPQSRAKEKPGQDPRTILRLAGSTLMTDPLQLPPARAPVHTNPASTPPYQTDHASGLAL